VFDPGKWLPTLPPELSEGLLPFVVVLAGVFGFYWGLKKIYAATKSEAIQSVFVLLLVAFIILTMVGVWFRGTGMSLAWPWA
jgi:hypothetical protein